MGARVKDFFPLPLGRGIEGEGFLALHKKEGASCEAPGVRVTGTVVGCVGTRG
jgi:hypothetical protein